MIKRIIYVFLLSMSVFYLFRSLIYILCWNRVNATVIDVHLHPNTDTGWYFDYTYVYGGKKYISESKNGYANKNKYQVGDDLVILCNDGESMVYNVEDLFMTPFFFFLLLILFHFFKDLITNFFKLLDSSPTGTDVT